MVIEERSAQRRYSERARTNKEERMSAHVFSPSRRTFISTAAMSAAIPLILTSRHATAAESVTLEIEHGKLRGMRESGAVSFKGIPYAAPTGGRNRFLAP